jgi:ribosomal protein L11
MAAGAALAAKRVEAKKSSLKDVSKSIAKSMSKKQLEEIARTKLTKLPTKKRKK